MRVFCVCVPCMYIYTCVHICAAHLVPKLRPCRQPENRPRLINEGRKEGRKEERRKKEGRKERKDGWKEVMTWGMITMTRW
jgi:hypothetical protein